LLFTGFARKFIPAKLNDTTVNEKGTLKAAEHDKYEKSAGSV
jgi:hypothetical protein